jgi:hypothetical protein
MVMARNIVSFAMGHVYVRESYKTLRLGFRVLLSLGSKRVCETGMVVMGFLLQWYLHTALLLRRSILP